MTSVKRAWKAEMQASGSMKATKRRDHADDGIDLVGKAAQFGGAHGRRFEVDRPLAMVSCHERLSAA